MAHASQVTSKESAAAKLYSAAFFSGDLLSTLRALCWSLLFAPSDIAVGRRSIDQGRKFRHTMPYTARTAHSPRSFSRAPQRRYFSYFFKKFYRERAIFLGGFLASCFSFYGPCGGARARRDDMSTVQGQSDRARQTKGSSAFVAVFAVYCALSVCVSRE